MENDNINAKTVVPFEEQRSTRHYSTNNMLQLGEQCDPVPPFWSRKLDEFLFQSIHASDEALIVHSKAVAKASARDLVIGYDPDDPEITADDAAELDSIVRSFSQYGQGLEAAMRLFWGDVFISCNGGILYVMGQSEMIQAPESMRYRDEERLIAGGLKALEDDDGNLVTLSSGLPIFGVGLLHLDTRRCQRTGDPVWPVIYSPSKGNNIPLHHSRIISYVDNPSPDRDHNGIGRCAALRCIRSVLKTQWDFRLHGSEVGDMPSYRILYPEYGISFAEFEASLAAGVQNVLNGNGSIIIMGKEEEAMMGGDDRGMSIGELSLKQFPDDYNEEQSFLLHITTIGIAHYLGTADLGITSFLRSASRDNAEAEEQATAETGIPEMQTAVYKSMNKRLFPSGVFYEGESLVKVDPMEQTAVDYDRQQIESGYIADGILSPLTILERLFADGKINEEQYERELKRITANGNRPPSANRGALFDASAPNGRSHATAQPGAETAVPANPGGDGGDLDKIVKALEVLQGMTAEEIARVDAMIEKTERELQGLAMMPPGTPVGFNADERINEGGELATLLALFQDLFDRQYTAVNLRAIHRDAMALDIDVSDPAFVEALVPSVADNTPALKDDEIDADFALLLALLLVFGERGNVDGELLGNRPLTGVERRQIGNDTISQLNERIGSLFGIAPEDNSDQASGRIFDPRLAQPLDAQSWRDIAILYRTAVLLVADAGGAQSYQRIEDEYNALIAGKTEQRAFLVGDNEAARAYGVGTWVAVDIFLPLTKTLTPSFSKNTRPHHDIDVGTTIPYDGIFPNAGIFFAPGEVIGCKHGIIVGF